MMFGQPIHLLETALPPNNRPRPLVVCHVALKRDASFTSTLSLSNTLQTIWELQGWDRHCPILFLDLLFPTSISAGGPLSVPVFVESARALSGSIYVALAAASMADGDGGRASVAVATVHAPC